MPYALSNSTTTSSWTTHYWPLASGSSISSLVPVLNATTADTVYEKAPRNSSMTLDYNCTSLANTNVPGNTTIGHFHNCSITSAPLEISYNTSLIMNSTVYGDVTRNFTMTPVFSKPTEPTTTTLSTLTVRRTVYPPESPAPPSGTPPQTATTTETPVLYTTVVQVPTELTTTYCVTTVITSLANVTTVMTGKSTTTTVFVDKTTTVKTCPDSELPTSTPTDEPLTPKPEEPTTTFSITLTQTFTIDSTTVSLNPTRHTKQPIPRPFAQTLESIGLPEVFTPERPNPTPIPAEHEPYTPPVIPNPPSKTFSLSPPAPIYIDDPDYKPQPTPDKEPALEPIPELLLESTPTPPPPSSPVTLITPHTSRPMAIGHNGGFSVAPSVVLLFFCHFITLSI